LFHLDAFAFRAFELGLLMFGNRKDQGEFFTAFFTMKFISRHGSSPFEKIKAIGCSDNMSFWRFVNKYNKAGESQGFLDPDSGFDYIDKNPGNGKRFAV